MVKRLLILIWFILLVIPMFGEDDDFSKLKNLNLEDFEIKIDEIIIYKSTGLFPNDRIGNFNYSFFTDLAYNFNLASNLRSSYLVETKNPFFGRLWLEDDERKIKKAFSYTEEDEYPESYFLNLGLSAEISTGLPMVVKFNSGISWTNSFLNSIDNSKQYINKYGELKELKEACIFYLEEILINLGTGLLIPIYGAYFEGLGYKTSSIYYFYIGFNYKYPLKNTAIQYYQIANAKDDIRYSNGVDTTVVFSKSYPKGINFNRYNLELGLGYDFKSMDQGLFLQLFFNYQLNSFLLDANWHQYQFGLKIGLHLKSFFE